MAINYVTTHTLHCVHWSVVSTVWSHPWEYLYRHNLLQLRILENIGIDLLQLRYWENYGISAFEVAHSLEDNSD